LARSTRVNANKVVGAGASSEAIIANFWHFIRFTDGRFALMLCQSTLIFKLLFSPTSKKRIIGKTHDTVVIEPNKTAISHA